MRTLKLGMQHPLVVSILLLFSCSVFCAEDSSFKQHIVDENVHKNEDEVNRIGEAEVEDESTKLANDLFTAAMAMLNSSNSDKDLAWDTMKKAAEVGSKNAQAKIAFAKLLGSYFDQASERILVI